MIKNIDLKDFELDFFETLNQFGEADTNDVDLYSSENGNKYLVEVIVKKKSYKTEYPIITWHNEIEEKRFKKRFLKLSLYKALSNYYNKTLPWGALTGIRPTKLCYMSVEKGESCKSFLMDEMFVSLEKASLVEKIIKEQKPYYVVDEDESDLFVNIPFCPTRCAYCSFLSSEISKEKYVNEYIEALIKEIEFSKKYIKKLRSIYIGGGTPVSITTAQLEKVLSAIGNNNVEFTVEAGRPDCIDEEKLLLLKKYGVNRVCVNPQTFSDDTLKIIGRKHTSLDAIEKIKLAKSMGFIVNTDLIAGLPKETFETFKNSLDTAISLLPDNITVHTLAVKRGSKIFEEQLLKSRNEKVEKSSLASESYRTEIDRMLSYTHSELNKNGYNPYYLYRLKNTAGNHENTGYAKKNTVCVYNIDIMEETANIVACGAHSVSKKIIRQEDKIVRYGNPKDILTYINKIEMIISDKNELFT